MGDDLVRRLRAVQNLTGGHLCIAHEAADRIEALEAALREIAETTDNQYYFWCQAIARRALEGKP